LVHSLLLPAGKRMLNNSAEQVVKCCNSDNLHSGEEPKLIGIVSELMGWVSNVVLIKCIFGTGGPRGGGISGGRVYEPGEGMRKLVYEQPGNEVDGSCHRRRVPSK
jgi:hypothetical protein